MGEFGIGQPVRREEDPILLEGKGRYVDDVRMVDTAHAVVLRSPHAHADLVSIDVAAARAAPGVLTILTRDEFKARGLGMHRPSAPRKKSDGSPAYVCNQPLLALDRVRYVGQPVVFVVADTLDQAKDAAELIEVEYKALPALVSAVAALEDGAPAIWDDNPGNEAFHHEVGNKEAVDAAFANADHVVSNTTVINRVTTNSMEPRGCIGEYDPTDDRYTLRATIQSVHGTRAVLADQIFREPHTKFRVICDNMGGGFGMKGGCGLEYCLSLWASEVVGRPVKWISTRSEGILSDEQARDSVTETELALDKNGKFLALRTHSKHSIGAYNTSDRNINPTLVAISCLANTYTTPAIHAQVTGALTNTMMIAFYRGGGRPEPLYVIETIVDKAARELGMDPAELRRRNTVPADAMPFTTALRQVYDCGDFQRNLDEALEKISYDDAEQRRAEAKARGRLVGVGVSNTVAPSAGMGSEHAEVRFDPSGTITLITGGMDHGQGHGTTFKQVLSDKLGVEFGDIRYRFGDTDKVTAGTGTFGSRTATLAGSAIVMAAEKLIEKGKRIAAHLLEAAESDIEFNEGSFAVAGTDKSVSITDVAKASFKPNGIPVELEPGFYERADFATDKGASFPNGAHICEVEIDADTGDVHMTRYAAVDDVGVVLNPLLFHGQIYGGIAQGAGQALMENIVWDDTGQLLSGSFLDYTMPRADDFCRFDIDNNEVPTERNLLGVKGAGEAGTCGALSAVMNAVNDALHHAGAPLIEMPATPERVWQAIQAGR